jgi:hypothetical protein
MVFLIFRDGLLKALCVKEPVVSGNAGRTCGRLNFFSGGPEATILTPISPAA